MHELAIIQELVRLVFDQTDKPRKVFVELGLLSTYKKEPLQFYFDAMKSDIEELKGTTLIVHEVEGKISCDSCNNVSVVVDPLMLFCPLCESFETTIIQGKNFYLKKIEE